MNDTANMRGPFWRPYKGVGRPAETFYIYLQPGVGVTAHLAVIKERNDGRYEWTLKARPTFLGMLNPEVWRYPFTDITKQGVLPTAEEARKFIEQQFDYTKQRWLPFPLRPHCCQALATGDQVKYTPSAGPSGLSTPPVHVFDVQVTMEGQERYFEFTLNHVIYHSDPFPSDNKDPAWVPCAQEAPSPNIKLTRNGKSKLTITDLEIGLNYKQLVVSA